MSEHNETPEEMLQRIFRDWELDKPKSELPAKPRQAELISRPKVEIEIVNDGDVTRFWFYLLTPKGRRRCPKVFIGRIAAYQFADQIEQLGADVAWLPQKGDCEQI